MVLDGNRGDGVACQFGTRDRAVVDLGRGQLFFASLLALTEPLRMDVPSINRPA